MCTHILVSLKAWNVTVVGIIIEGPDNIAKLNRTVILMCSHN